MQKKSRKKNILFFSRNWLPSVGGSTIMYHNLYSMLDNKIIVVTDKKYKNKNFDKKQKYKIIRINFDKFDIFDKINYKFNFLGYGKIRIGEFLKFNYYALYLLFICKIKGIKEIHSDGTYYSIIPSLINKFSKIDYSIWVHDQGNINPFRSNLKKKVILNANKIFAACTEISNLIKEKYSQNSFIIKPGIDHGKIKPDYNYKSIIDKYSLKGKKIILTLSRISKNKGIDIVLDLMPELIQKVPNLVYLIGGKGEELKELKKKVKKLKIEKYVKFIGFVSEKDKCKYYTLADIFIMLNRPIGGIDMEGFGMVFAESLTCQTPVIGGNTGGTYDSIHEGITGFRVNVKNKKETLKKITYLLKNKKNAVQMGKKGREISLNEFGWEKRIKKLEKYIQ